MGELVPVEVAREEKRQSALRAYEQVIEMLDREIAKSKDNGDFQTAEVFELVRAKVKAHRDKV